MESLRVDICYRPLRIGWAIRAGDIDSFRSAVRRSFALWGGRFNPIIIVDHEESSKSLVNLFRLDMIVPVGNSDIVQGFPKRFPHLIKPFTEDEVFTSYGDFGARSHVLDIYNALVHVGRKPEWDAVKKKGVRFCSWGPDDPLADVFLVQFGGYPSPTETHIDYRRVLEEGAEASEIKIEPLAVLSPDLLDHPSISFVSRYGIERRHGISGGWSAPGFYSGDSRNLDDLVTYWNLRAADIPLLYALPVADLFEKVFDLSGFSSSLSEGGLIARQLIAQLGGVDGARPFKIPGVRRLLKTHGPRAPFTKKSALELIGGQDPESPGTTFKDYERLYIEPRPAGSALDPPAVFTYLVEKGLFRMGAELKCPHCRLDSWVALDALKQLVVCELCGQEFDATRQLVQGAWHYRRSGVLGGERNAQGAIPVVLTLQQFQFNMNSFGMGVYSPSIELKPKAVGDLPECEIDFVWMIPQPFPKRTAVIIGECKDRGSRKRDGSKDEGTIDERDVDNLKRVADALPRERFKAFIVLAKLCPFTEGEIALAKTLNDEYRRRVILLTARELEPYHFYERTKLEFKSIREYAGAPEDLANTTAEMYFKEKEA